MNSRQLLASLARKTLVFIAMMFLLSLIVFYVSRLPPGDPLQSFYGDAMQSMTTTELDAARERLGLNGPIWMQYAKWIGNVMQGDFGISLKYKRPVLDVVSPLIGNTLMLGGIAYALVFLLAIALALFCARFEDTFMDRFVCRIGTVAFEVDGVHPHDVGQYIDAQGIAIRVGHHCAQPIHRHFGVFASNRASSGIYNTPEDAQALVEAVEGVRRFFLQ